MRGNCVGSESLNELFCFLEELLVCSVVRVFFLVRKLGQIGGWGGEGEYRSASGVALSWSVPRSTRFARSSGFLSTSVSQLIIRAQATCACPLSGARAATLPLQRRIRLSL